MTDDGNSPGGRLPLLEPAAMTRRQRAYYGLVHDPGAVTGQGGVGEKVAQFTGPS